MEQKPHPSPIERPSPGILGPVVAVVEDTPSFRKFLSLALKTIGCTPVELATGTDVENLLDRGEVRLVILDWNLEGVPATATLDAVLAAGVPALVVTGDPEAVGPIPCRVLGKPVHLESLKAAVSEILELK